MLTDKHKETHMGSSLMRHHQEQCEAFLSRIAKGDVTWVFHNIPDSMAEFMTWKQSQSPVKKKFKASAVST
jgi:hypothetical protein